MGIHKVPTRCKLSLIKGCLPVNKRAVHSLMDRVKSAQNHENTICLLSKALSQIASSLPRVELAMILYPTERMRVAVGNLYANLIRFFIRAHEWCSEGSLRHMLHSITRPVELRYKDLLADIADDSREIDQLALWGSHVETREINLKLTDIATKLDSYHVLQSSSLLDTNQRLSDLQFSQIMSHVSTGKLGDPLGAYRFNQSIQRRRSRSGALEATNKFWQSPKLANWSFIQESKVVVMSGNFRARFAMRNFSLEIIQQLQSQHVPVLWVLPGPKGDGSEATGVSAIDLIKSLIHQVLQLEKDVMTESGMALQCAQFHRATTEQEWLQLLGSALLRARSQVYMVLDLSMLDRNLQHPDGFSWLAAFQQLFTEVAKRSSNLQVKVLLLCDGPGQWMQNGQNASPDVVVPVKVTQTPVRRKKRGPDPPMRFTIRPSGRSRGS